MLRVRNDTRSLNMNHTKTVMKNTFKFSFAVFQNLFNKEKQSFKQLSLNRKLITNVQRRTFISFSNLK